MSRSQVAGKAAPAAIGEQAHKLTGSLLIAYPVPAALSKVLDPKHRAMSHQNRCASCHGGSGHTDDVLAAKLSSSPIALVSHQQVQECSVFVFQQIIMCSAEGTLIPSFAQLTDDDRWALAYFVPILSYSDADRRVGAKLWASRPELHGVVPMLTKPGQTPETSLAKSTNPDAVWQLTAHLRSTLGVLSASTADSPVIAKDELKEGVAAFDQSDKATASCLAFSAYLGGLGPAEPALAAKNQALFQNVKKTMGLYRNTIATGQAGQVQGITQRL